MTKENQKPLYKTRYMLDELGNLQSEGHGISGFETMLSIGLGQEQQFTLILQTLQQLKDVYGDSVDKIVQGNASNIIFLKSTDETMLKTLEELSGTTHRVYKDQKTVTRDMEALVGNLSANEGKMTYTMSAKQVPVIDKNDMLFLAERNSIVFRAGDAPIWNKNEMILPMSWRLFGGKGEATPSVPGKDFTLQTIPTLSSAVDFDLKKNQPDFNEVLKHRMEQAVMAGPATESYKTIFEYDDDAFARLDDDVRSADIMDMINTQIERQKKAAQQAVSGLEDFPEMEPDFDDDWFTTEDNDEVVQAVAEKSQERAATAKKIYAHGQIAKSDLVNATGVASHMFDDLFSRAFAIYKGDFMRDPSFKLTEGSLYSADGETLYLEKRSEADAEALKAAAADAKSNVYADGDITSVDVTQMTSVKVTDEFYRYLASLPSWEGLIYGKFEAFVTKELSMDTATE